MSMSVPSFFSELLEPVHVILGRRTVREGRGNTYIVLWIERRVTKHLIAFLEMLSNKSYWIHTMSMLAVNLITFYKAGQAIRVIIK